MAKLAQCKTAYDTVRKKGLPEGHCSRDSEVSVDQYSFEGLPEEVGHCSRDSEFSVDPYSSFEGLPEEVWYCNRDSEFVVDPTSHLRACLRRWTLLLI